MSLILKALILRSIYAACMIAVAVSCGAPSALHAIGHDLSQTSCDAGPESSSIPAGFSAPGSVFSVDEKLNECWLQTLVSSVTHQSIRPATLLLSSPPTYILANAALVNSDFVSSDKPRHWASPRGPPAA